MITQGGHHASPSFTTLHIEDFRTAAVVLALEIGGNQ